MKNEELDLDSKVIILGQFLDEGNVIGCINMDDKLQRDFYEEIQKKDRHTLWVEMEALNIQLHDRCKNTNISNKPN